MLAIPLYIFFAAVTFWGFIDARYAASVYLGVATLFSCWLLLASWSLRTGHGFSFDSDYLSSDELQVFRRYAFYFVYPYQARQYSSTFSFVQALSVLWIGLFLWNRDWVFVVGFIALFFVASNMASYLNHGNFLRYHAAKGHLTSELEARLAVIEAVESKIANARSRGA
jgi:hypothetical protein